MKVLYCGLLFQTWRAGISPILNILPGTQYLIDEVHHASWFMIHEVYTITKI